MQASDTRTERPASPPSDTSVISRVVRSTSATSTSKVHQQSNTWPPPRGKNNDQRQRGGLAEAARDQPPVGHSGDAVVREASGGARALRAA